MMNTGPTKMELASAATLKQLQDLRKGMSGY
jgi:hypothetical protein